MRTSGASSGRESRGARDTDKDEPRFSPLGIVATSAPMDALLAALEQLRPQLQVRLRRISDSTGIETLYRVEVATDSMNRADSGQIGPWLLIKSALLAAFPAGKAGAVKAIDP